MHRGPSLNLVFADAVVAFGAGHVVCVMLFMLVLALGWCCFPLVMLFLVLVLLLVLVQWLALVDVWCQC